jgi:hypothetical protein
MRSYLTTDVRRTLHAKPLGVSLRCEQLILVNKAVNKKERLEKELEVEVKKLLIWSVFLLTRHLCMYLNDELPTYVFGTVDLIEAVSFETV